MQYRPLGKSGLQVPPIVFGTSCLGNLYQAHEDETKLAIMREWFACVDGTVVVDSAGKYGAGLALEVMGKGLAALAVSGDRVIISNKLGWLRTPLRTAEPTFEPGAWMGLEHDAAQHISDEGILQCWEQGCELLGDRYKPQLASVHDPDEYLTGADRDDRWQDVLGAYRALGELKARGDVTAVGVGSKDWTVIRALADEVELDWVMFACSLTVYTHPPELLAFMAELHSRGVGIINSAVFNAGFLVGGAFFDYRKPDPVAEADLFAWRDRFLALCRAHDVAPAHACVQFGLSVPGVVSVALNTSNPNRIRRNVDAVNAHVPAELWQSLRTEGLISDHYPYTPDVLSAS
jgi:D-threo-aldose 1-dehydrogenase